MRSSGSISELMIPVSGYPKVKEDDSLSSAIARLRQYYSEDREHRSMLVTGETEDATERIVGILRINDIMSALKHLTRSYDSDEVSRMAHSLGDYGTRMRQDKEVDLRRGFEWKVKEVMPQKPHRVDIDQSPAETLQIMLLNNVDVLAVCQNGQIVGIIRAVDLLEYISQAWTRASDDRHQNSLTFDEQPPE